MELDAYAEVVGAEQDEQAHLDHAQQQHLTRLRYEVELAQRQFTRVDPDNRLVAAELETRWEAALGALRYAEEVICLPQRQPSRVAALPAELQTQFRAVGQHLPQLWRDGRIEQAYKKALLRGLIDKVVVQRLARDCVQARIVWKGGATTTLEVAVTVGSLADLTGAAQDGYRSPPRTVRRY